MTWTFNKTKAGPPTARGVHTRAPVRARKPPQGDPFASRSRAPLTLAPRAHPPYAPATHATRKTHAHALTVIVAGRSHKRV